MEERDRSEDSRRAKPDGYRAAVEERIRTFGYALEGIRHMAGQANFRIQVAIGAAAFIVAGLLRVGPAEWLALILVTLAVLLMEMLNTVIESVTDLASPQHHPLAKVAKDVGAGAVMTAAIASIVVGIYIFVPPLGHLFGWW